MTEFGIEPSEGCVAIEFLEQETASHARPAPVATDESDALLATCVGVGRGVDACKRGDTVKVRPYARNGVKLGSNVVMVEAYCVLGLAS